MNVHSGPLVSVVLPTHNGRRYLADSIQSCVAQTYRNWELIVVDDGSSEDVAGGVEAGGHGDPRIRVHRHPSRKGLPAALNTGFSLAEGSLLTWTSDDNLYREDALDVMVSYLSTRPSVDCVYTDFVLIGEQGQTTSRITVSEPRYLIFENCIGPSFLYRRSLWQDVGEYTEDLFLAEDYDFWLRASATCSMGPLHEPVYYYRSHGRSLTATRQKDIAIATEDAVLRNLPGLNWPSASDNALTCLR